jgi:hypothetical protein
MPIASFTKNTGKTLARQYRIKNVQNRYRLNNRKMQHVPQKAIPVVNAVRYCGFLYTPAENKLMTPMPIQTSTRVTNNYYKKNNA